MNISEFHDYDINGEDLGPELIEQGLRILASGRVVITDRDEYGEDPFEVTDIRFPQEAAYYAYRSRGVPALDLVTIELQKVTALGAAIGEVAVEPTGPPPVLIFPNFAYRVYHQTA